MIVFSLISSWMDSSTTVYSFVYPFSIRFIMSLLGCRHVDDGLSEFVVDQPTPQFVVHLFYVFTDGWMDPKCYNVGAPLDLVS